MEDEAWRSVTVVDDKKGQPHVLQQRVKVYTQGRDEESAGYTKPEMKHRLVPVKDVVNRLGVKWFERRSLSSSRKSSISVRPRGTRPVPPVDCPARGDGALTGVADTPVPV
jgi:hypothetical protein